ncbi:MAG: acyl-CoA thioesterase [Bradymonadaceae bacterium]|nr:acyl-CoA thioesterase [Lujinxingiaceae bacterium]
MPTYIPESLEQELLDYGTEPMIRVVMMPKDTNYHGFIFGGVILSHLDLAASEEALKAAGRNIVTKVIREVNFIAKVEVGDWVSFYTRTEQTGRTSVTVRVLVVAHRGTVREKLFKVTSAEAVFVAIDDDGRPAPLLGNHPATTPKAGPSGAVS